MISNERLASWTAPDDAESDEESVVRTTVTIDDELLRKAEALTGVTERAALLRVGLETLVRVESARRLAALGGSDAKAASAPRRRQGAA